MKKKFVITFSGVPGSSKTPIAYYLSWNLGLPIFNNDTLRTESIEDTGSFNPENYTKLRDARLDQLLALNTSFIYDASIDRQWASGKVWLDEHNYEHFVINMELDRDFVETLYKAKGYTQTDKLEGWFEDHAKFLRNYPDVPNIHITSEAFPERLNISLKNTKEWINE